MSKTLYVGGKDGGAPEGWPDGRIANDVVRTKIHRLQHCFLFFPSVLTLTPLLLLLLLLPVHSHTDADIWIAGEEIVQI